MDWPHAWPLSWIRILYHIKSNFLYYPYTPRSVLTFINWEKTCHWEKSLVLESEQALAKILEQICTHQTAFKEKQVTIAEGTLPPYNDFEGIIGERIKCTIVWRVRTHIVWVTATAGHRKRRSIRQSYKITGGSLVWRIVWERNLWCLTISAFHFTHHKPQWQIRKWIKTRWVP